MSSTSITPTLCKTPTSTKTNDELWTEFTDFSSYLEYKKINTLSLVKFFLKTYLNSRFFLHKKIYSKFTIYFLI